MTMVEKALRVPGSVDVKERWASAIITRNAAMKEILRQAKMVAENDARVLITRERGNGKELLAQPQKFRPIVVSV
jgi:DNA-binding NtrC family response regulator